MLVTVSIVSGMSPTDRKFRRTLRTSKRVFQKTIQRRSRERSKLLCFVGGFCILKTPATADFPCISCENLRINRRTSAREQNKRLIIFGDATFNAR